MTSKKYITITGRKPLTLDDTGILTKVLSGFADLFFVILDNSLKPVFRLHLARIVPGQAVPGMVAGDGNGRLMIFGIGEARVTLEPLDHLLEKDVANTHKILYQWFSLCFESSARNLKLPKTIQLEEAGGVVKIPAGNSLKVPGPGWCIKAMTGEACFLDVPVQKLKKPLPLPENGWLTAITDLCLTLDPLSATPKDVQDSIQIFQTCIATVLTQQRKTFVEDDRQGYHRQVAADRGRMEIALQGVTGILSKKKIVAMKGVTPQIAACILVAEASGIAIAEDTANPKSGMDPDLDDIARYNGFRTRAILLIDKWWANDHGPLLAFRKKDDSPVALIPKGHSAYLSVAPLTREKRLVTKALSETLKPYAHMFYRPFPHKQLNWLDLVKFGIFGNGNDLAWIIIMGVIAGLLGLLIPFATGKILGTLIPNAARIDILQITLILVATSVAIAMFNVVKGIASIRISGRMDLNIQAAVWDRLIALPVPFFKNFTAGDLGMRSMTISSIHTILSGPILNASLILVFSSFNLVFLFYYDWQMAIIAICMIFIGILVALLAAIVTFFYQKDLFEIKGTLMGKILQFICGINKLRSTGAEGRVFTLFAKDYARQKQANFNSGKVDAFLFAFNAGFPVLVSMVLFSWYYWRRMEYLTVAEFVAFTVAYTTFQASLLQVYMLMPAIVKIFPLYQRAKPILDALPEFNQNSKKIGPLKGRIDVSHVNFRYKPNGPLILKDVSISADQGKFIALVGQSCAGKSTLLRLLLGFETPETGGVFYDEQDLKNLDVREVRRQTGVVLQDGKFMGGNIFQNIVGTSNLTMDDAWEAARMVGIAEEIEAMPMKMLTVIAAGGGVISGGQQQRLLIANALINRPRIIFFDEATSALDNRTQAIVQKSLENLKLTRIVIAHRLSTIINADIIYVLHQGSVVETGSYDELIAKKGYFHQLAERQLY